MQELAESQLDRDPIHQFDTWFQGTAGLRNPNAMTLATATPDGKPSARMVLLKGYDARGFVFFTNYDSRKAAELETNNYAAAVFYWQQLDRQVRIEGSVERVSGEESDAYFDSRPRGSKLSAWASRQSEVLPDRAALERTLADVTRRFSEQEVPRPAYWGGYRLRPEVMEFWQGRPDRLHDRIRYERVARDNWKMVRLSP